MRGLMSRNAVLALTLTTLLLEHASSNLRPNDRSIVARKRYNRFVSLYRGYHVATYINMLKCIMHGRTKRYWIPHAARVSDTR